MKRLRGSSPPSPARIECCALLASHFGADLGRVLRELGKTSAGTRERLGSRLTDMENLADVLSRLERLSFISIVDAKAELKEARETRIIVHWTRIMALLRYPRYCETAERLAPGSAELLRAVFLDGGLSLSADATAAVMHDEVGGAGVEEFIVQERLGMYNVVLDVLEREQFVDRLKEFFERTIKFGPYSKVMQTLLTSQGKHLYAMPDPDFPVAFDAEKVMRDTAVPSEEFTTALRFLQDCGWVAYDPGRRTGTFNRPAILKAMVLDHIETLVEFHGGKAAHVVFGALLGRNIMSLPDLTTIAILQEAECKEIMARLVARGLVQTRAFLQGGQRSFQIKGDGMRYGYVFLQREAALHLSQNLELAMVNQLQVLAHSTSPEARLSLLGQIEKHYDELILMDLYCEDFS